MWSKCYHSFIYPNTEFIHVECNNTSSANTSTKLHNLREEQPLANSTLLDSSMPLRSGNTIQNLSNCSPRNPQGSIASQAENCPRNSGNCNIDPCPRNIEILEGDDHVSCSRNTSNNCNECNGNPPRNPRYSTSNSCLRISACVSNECQVNHCPRNPNVSTESQGKSCPRSSSRCSGTYCVNEDPSYDVGHMSHIPRTPPTPTTYTVPTLGKNISSTCGTGGTVESTQNMCSSTRPTLKTNLSYGNSQTLNMGTTSTAVRTTFCQDESLFGMIALKENDVCYTSGTIEWVGRKRSYPLNTGFKVIKDNCNRNSIRGNEPKKKRKSDKTFTVGMDSTRECDCTDMLPTVNAIVEHLNALHEAVDLVDLRLSNLEETL